MNMIRGLKESMKRVPAPPGFAERAVGRVKLVGRRNPFSYRALSRLAAAFALVTIASVSGYRYTEHRRGEAAKKQLLVALQITAEKADIVRRAIQK